MVENTYKLPRAFAFLGFGPLTLADWPKDLHETASRLLWVRFVTTNVIG